MDKKSNLSRRDFLNITALGTAAMVTPSFIEKATAKTNLIPAENAKVLLIMDEKAAIVPDSTKKFPVNQEIAQKMMDAGIKKFTGIDDLGQAWKSFFPGITKDKKISIKVNCIAAGNYGVNGLVSHPEVAYAIVNGLKTILIDGSPIPEENITIWDLSDSEMKTGGYTLNKSDKGFKCYGTRLFPNSGMTDGYETNVSYKINGTTQYLSKIFTENTDYLINLAVLKDHFICGITLSMKNHYGTIHNPGPNAMHDSNCNPAIQMVNSIEMIRKKQVLCIIDAIYGVKSGGPNMAPQITPNSLLFGTDTVALDTAGSQFLIENGCSESKRTMASYIKSAGNDPYNIGVNDLSKIDFIREDITTRIAGVNEPNNQFDNDHLKIFSNYPNPFKNQTNLAYQLFKPANVNIKIFDLKGSLVTNIIDKQQPEGYYSIPWNAMNNNGLPVPDGMYLAKFNIGEKSHTIKLIKN